MYKVLSMAAIALVAIAPSLTNQAQAQGNNDATSSGTQLAMAVPTCDPASLRIVAQKNYQCSQFRIAQQMYKQVCQQPGASANDYYWLGESYMHASMFSEAAGAFADGVKLAPTSDSLNVSLVHSLIASKQMNQAHDVCLKAASSVADPQTRKQLAVLLKIASMPLPPAMQRDLNAANHVER